MNRFSLTIKNEVTEEEREPEYQIKFLTDHEIFDYGVFLNTKFIYAGTFEECCEKRTELYFKWLLSR